MRFLTIPTIVYIDVNGNSYPVKDIRPIATFQTGSTLFLQKGNLPDEIMSRREYYNNGNEDLSWALVEHNIKILTEYDFDFDKVKSINIPIVEAY